jgi:hypothetical protein
MTGLRSGGAAFLSRARMADGQSVYVYRDAERLAISARGVPITYETQRGDVVLQAQRVDWLFRAVDYAFGGTPCDPEEGDLVVRTSGNRTETYEVQAMDTEGCFRRLDAEMVNLRVFTHLVEQTMEPST